MPRIREHAAYFSPQVTRTRRFYHADWKRQSTKGKWLDVVGGGCEWCAADFAIERTNFPYVAFEFVWAGRGYARLGKEAHSLIPGVAFFFDRTVPHVIRSDATQPLVKYFFNFAGTRIDALLESLRLRAGTALQVAEPARLAELLDEAIDHALKGTALGLRTAAACLEHALALCAEGRRPANAQSEPAFATYLRCRQYLLRHYPSSHSITEVARECHVSGAYLTRLFQRFDRETPYTCLQRLRMNEALLKLRQPGAQVKAVAAELEFRSAAHFSRAFKARHGIPPVMAMRNTRPLT
jgi:AraC family transcriptional regulator, arabinose operon regulatory protein